MQRVTTLITNQHIERLEALCQQLSQAITVTAYQPEARTRAVDALMSAGDWLHDYNNGIIDVQKWQHIMTSGFTAVMDCLVAVGKVA